MPLFVMSYWRTRFFTWGVKRFVTECTRCGAQGLIVPDLPLDYDEGLFKLAADAGICAVPVVPLWNSRGEARRIAVYIPPTCTQRCVSARRAPARALLPTGFLPRRSALPSAATMKILGGFGVSTGEQVKQVATLTHAVVVGSAIVRAIEAGGDPRCAAREKMAELVGRSGSPRGPSPR